MTEPADLLTLYSDIQTVPVNWLWYPYIAVGKITLLQGDPGDGKSTMMLNLIAELSRGGAAPDGRAFGRPQRIIYQCSEDGMSARELRRKQMEREFSFDGYYAIRKELYADLKDPAMTIRDGSISFNNACIGSLENVMFVETFFNYNLKRYALSAAKPGTPGSLRWCTIKTGKEVRGRFHVPM